MQFPLLGKSKTVETEAEWGKWKCPGVSQIFYGFSHFLWDYGQLWDQLLKLQSSVKWKLSLTLRVMKIRNRGQNSFNTQSEVTHMVFFIVLSLWIPARKAGSSPKAGKHRATNIPFDPMTLIIKFPLKWLKIYGGKIRELKLTEI